MTKPAQPTLLEREMLELLRLASAALNSAPRFKVQSLPKEADDSYKIAAKIDRLIRKAGA